MFHFKQGLFTCKTIRCLGRGGLGIVDEVEVTASNCDIEVGQRLACKRLNMKLKNNPTARKRFEREIKAVRGLDHPCIIPLIAENVPRQERCYFMPIFPGSLRDVLSSKGSRVGFADVLRFGEFLCAGLAHAHARNIFHRDLKPENILISTAGEPVICDWGLGYFVHKHSMVLDLTVGGMGTEYYCSSEQWKTGKCDGTGDIYSLGMVLAELAQGRRAQIIQGHGIEHDVLPNHSSPYSMFNKLIREMTAFFPANRPRAVSTVKVRLRNIGRQLALYL